MYWNETVWVAIKNIIFIQLMMENTDNLFDYQCFLLEIGKRVPVQSGAGEERDRQWLSRQRARRRAEERKA